MSKEQTGNRKYQLNIFAGHQSYIYRTNSEKEVAKFTGLKKITAETVGRFLQDLHLRLGTYDIPLAPEPKKKEKVFTTLPNFRTQLIAKLALAKKKPSKSQLKRINAMPEKQAQLELVGLLRGKK